MRCLRHPAGAAAIVRTSRVRWQSGSICVGPPAPTGCRTLAVAAARRDGASRVEDDEQAPEASRVLRPRRRSLFGSSQRRHADDDVDADAEERPSTSGRERVYGGRYGGRYDGEDRNRRPGGRFIRDDGDGGRDGDRGSSRRRSDGERDGDGDGSRRGSYGRREGDSRGGRGGDRRDGDGDGGRAVRDDRGGGRGGGGRGGRGRGRGGSFRGGRDTDRPATERQSSRRGGSATDAAAQDVPAAAAAAEPPSSPPVGAPRPPGSSTGNRPLPYDLPIVRPYDGDKGTFFAGASWRQVGASEDVIAALKALGIARPSHIQAQAFPVLARAPGKTGGADSGGGGGGAVALADQAGSGKTLAYLLPMLQLLREEEEAAGGRVTRPNRPRGIVLAPTVELVQQVLRVARAVSGAGLRLRSAAFTGGQADEKARAASLRTQRDLLSEGLDLLVATPGRLQQHLAAGSLLLDDCRLLVLDEVDVLLGASADFLSQVSPLRAAAPPGLRFVLVSATLPQHVMATLRSEWPDLRAVFGPGLHRTAAGLVEELVDCSGGEEVSEESGRRRKLEALQALLDRHRSPRTLVFCNKIDACRDVENFLSRADPRQRKYRVLPYHEAIRDGLRAEHLLDFLRPVAPAAAAAASSRRPGEQQQQQQKQKQKPERKAAQQRRRDALDDEEEGADEPAPAPQEEGAGEEGGEPMLVLVATDRTSRGIDAPDCGHVVLFDFPRDPSEYVRRVGRTARGAGGRGTVSSLVLGRQVPLAREIIQRNQKGMPVHSLPDE